MTMWKQQKKMDHEPYHTPELYVVWNEKLNFLTESIASNTFDSDYFIWTDIGCFRDYRQLKDLKTYPNSKETSRTLGRDRMFFLQMSPFSKNATILDRHDGFPAHDFQHDTQLAGTVVGGHKDAIQAYAVKYYETMDVMRQKGRFIGKDQNIMSTVAVRYPELVHLVAPRTYWVWSERTGNWSEGDPWAYSLYYFTAESNKRGNLSNIFWGAKPPKTASRRMKCCLSCPTTCIAEEQFTEKGVV